MLSAFYRNIFLLTGVGLLCPLLVFSQEKDSLTTRQLLDVEVVEKVRPSVTREVVPVQRMDKERIEQLGLQNLSEVVRSFSGVILRDYGGIGGMKTVSVRGLGAHHTGVSYDGITLTDAQSGQVDISRFSLDNVESVSLTMGQGADIFQTARMYASAAVLNIQTERPDFTNKPVSLKAGIDAGSFGFFNPSLRYGQKLTNNYSFTFHSDWVQADSHYPYQTVYDNAVFEGKRNNSDVKSFRSELNFYSDWKKSGQLNVKGYWFDSKRGLPGSLIYRNDYSSERLQNKNGFVQAVYENSLREKFAIKGLGKIDYTRTCYQDFHSSYPDGVKTDVYTQREYYGSVLLKYTPSSYVTVTVAEDFFVNTLDASIHTIPSPERFSSLTALAARYMNNRLTVTGSLLNTFIREKTGDSSRDEDRKRLSPALSVSYRLFPAQNLRVRASFKDAFRVPTFNDLYYGQALSKSLNPERATQYNVGLTWSDQLPGLRMDYLSVSADAYYNKVRDKIVAFPTMFIWQMVNSGEVNIKGADINISSHVRLTDPVSLLIQGNYSWQEALDVSDKDSKKYKHQLPYTPVHSGNMSITLENPWLTVSWLMTAVGERFSQAQNADSNRMKGYCEHQLSFSRDLSLKRCLLKLHAEIINIGDVSYDIIRYYPMPGRSFRAGVKVVY